MATYNLGQAAIVSKGAWSSSVNYAVLNTVKHNGGSFMAIAPNSNVEPGVTSGWATYWVSTALGIKAVSITAVDSSTAQATVTFSDGTTATSGTFNTAAVGPGAIGTTQIAQFAVTGGSTGKLALATVEQTNMANNSVGTAQIIDGNVTAAKLNADVNYSAIGLAANQVRTIKFGTATPTTDDISDGEIYLQYS